MYIPSIRRSYQVIILGVVLVLVAAAILLLSSSSANQGSNTGVRPPTPGTAQAYAKTAAGSIGNLAIGVAYVNKHKSPLLSDVTQAIKEDVTKGVTLTSYHNYQMKLLVHTPFKTSVCTLTDLGPTHKMLSNAPVSTICG